MKFHYSQSNEWYDPIELYSFEANLATNIFLLIERVKNENFEAHKIHLLPFPKANKNGANKIRPFYKINIEDQIIWLAVVNVIGDFFESNFQSWNYGNRLYRPIWFTENSDGSSEINKGSTKNTSSYIYRKWSQSWPFFRRHINMTIRALSKGNNLTVDDFENDIEKVIYEDEMSKEHKEYNYLDGNYWALSESQELYWLTLDFEKFFPSIQPDLILQNIKEILINQYNRDDVSLIISRIEKLLKPKVCFSGWSLDDSIELKNYFVNDKSDNCKGIPTGLLVAGFLANVALLELDKKINSWINRNRNLAYFKFVDDQVIIAKSNEAIKSFLDFIHFELAGLNSNIVFNDEKIEPEIYNYDQKTGFSQKESLNDSDNKLNVTYPEPFLTNALMQISNLNGDEFSLMDESELENSENDLKFFLLTDFNDSGIRRDTRVSFAAMRLCKIAKYLEPNFFLFDQNYSNINPDLIEENKSIELNKIQLRYKRIFDLLLKATIEFPDKLKLWKRCVELCYISGIDKIDEIYLSVDKANIHAASKSYIKAYIQILLVEFMLQAKSRLFEKYSSYWDAYRLNLFISNVSKLEVVSPNENHILKSSSSLFHLIQDFVQNSNSDIYTNEDSEYSFEDYFYFILRSISANKTIWNNNILKIQLENRVSWAILGIYPVNIPPVLFESILNIKKELDSIPFQTKIKNYTNIIFERNDFILDNQGFMYDVFDSNSQLKKQFVEYYPKIRKNLSFNPKNRIPLNKWLKVTIANNSKSSWIDPSLSEWTVIEIVKQIASEKNRMYGSMQSNALFDDTIRNIFLVHPQNYLIPRTWSMKQKHSWDSWKRVVREDKISIIHVDKMIGDYRYIPFINYWETSGFLSIFFGNGFTSLIVGLCTLMVKLLSKDLSWHSSTNKQLFLDSFYSGAMSTIENQPISSHTQHFLNSIFSKKNEDFIFGQNKFFYNDLIIDNLTVFENALTSLQTELEKYQVTLLENEARQLTYIDIEEIGKHYSI
ncbi:MAG: RNA-directed DNA polymerase [Flavobacteriia bacterium]|nr:RNA-directed DNA polymerase [Flavobacteriia bacterium]